MPVSPSLKKGLFAVATVTALGGGLYWKLAAPTPPPTDPASLPLAKQPLDALGLSPYDREALAAGEALLAAGRYADALARLADIRSQDNSPGRLRAAVGVGRCLYNLGRLAEAERAFAYVAAERPDEPDAHRGLAGVYGFLGATGREEAHLRKVADLDPADYKPLMVLAANFVDLKLYGPAEEAAREGLRRRPPFTAEAALRRDLAEALVGQKKYEAALTALGPDPAPVPAARAVRAECLRMVNRPDDAAREVEAGLAAAAGDPKTRARLLLQRGWLLADRRDDVGAAKAFEAALADDEHDLGARLQLALAYRRLGDAARADAADARFKDSEARLKKVSALNHEAVERPWDGAIRRELADAYRALNLNALADHWLTAAAACEARKP